jgi:uncharacterized paraquat-inducible protein A
MGHVRCAACQWPIEVSSWNKTQGAHCEHCAQLVRAYVFPSITRASAEETPEALRDENEASCFYHPESRAAIPCDECGRFLCPVCDCQVEERHLCPGCLHTAARTKKIASFDNQRTNYDYVALLIALLPILFWPVTLISGPAAIYYSLRHWNSEQSVVGRSKIRFVLAILFGLGQVLSWIALFFTIWFAPRAR